MNYYYERGVRNHLETLTSVTKSLLRTGKIALFTDG